MKAFTTVAIVLLCIQASDAMPNGSGEGGNEKLEVADVEKTWQFDAQNSAAGEKKDSVKENEKRESSNDSESSQETTVTIQRSNKTYTIGGDDDCVGDNCRRNQYYFEVPEGDLELLGSEELQFFDKTEKIHHLHSNDCEKLVEKLNKDNDLLTSQLVTSNIAIAALTEDKTWGLKQIAECRDEYNCMMEDFITITYEVKMNKKKLKAADDEISKLNVKLNVANSEVRKWKDIAEGLDSELKRVKTINVKLEQTISENTNTINGLRTTITETNSKLNTCGTESDEWKRKYDSEKEENAKKQNTITELQDAVAELRARNSKLTDDLSCCRNTNREDDIKITNLGNDLDDYKKRLSNTTAEWDSCKLEVKKVTDEFEVDELDDYQQSIIKGRLEAQLNECRSRNTQLECDIDSEKKKVINCKKENADAAEECGKRYKKYEDELTELANTSHEKLEKCEGNFKNEQDTSSKLRSNINDLENSVADITNKLNIQIEISGDWKNKNQNCVDDSANLRRTIDTLTNDLNAANGRTDTCLADNNSLRNDVSTWKSSSDTCDRNLNDTEQKLAAKESAIGDLNIQIGSLNEGNRHCQSQLSSLRCDVSSYLTSARAAEDKAYAAVREVLDALGGNKDAYLQFVGSHDITCKAVNAL